MDTIYSKRLMQRENQNQPELYEYYYFPEPFKIQVVHIWNEATNRLSDFWTDIHDTLAKENGTFQLIHDSYRLLKTNDPFEICSYYLLLNKDALAILDVIELSFRYIDTKLRNMRWWKKRKYRFPITSDDAIRELNCRFKEHNLGYEFVQGQIVQINSRYLHNEAIKPAIHLMVAKGFEGALDEFLKAHEHYKNHQYKESIAEALKSFESTLKTICQLKGWEKDDKGKLTKNMTASPLITFIIKKELIPSYLQNHFDALLSCLSSGLPTVRNKVSGHGQGKDIIEVPEYFASYSLNLAATNIIFLISAYLESSKHVR